MKIFDSKESLKEIKVKNLDHLLNFDPLDTAEKLTNQTGDTTMPLAMTLMIAKNQAITNIMTEMGDTHLGLSWNEFKKMMEKSIIPFEIAWIGPFQNGKHQEEEIIWINTKKGLIIRGESYHGNCNTIHLYFEIKITGEINNIHNLLSGCSHSPLNNNPVEVDFDGRIGLWYKLLSLDMSQDLEFVPIWNSPDRFIWFVNYKEDDIKGYDYKAITNKKISEMEPKFQQVFGSRTGK